MRNLVIKIQSKHLVVNYIKMPPNYTQLNEFKHKRLFKQLIYNEIFTFYHPEMDFSNSTILIDNRNGTT